MVLEVCPWMRSPRADGEGSGRALGCVRASRSDGRGGGEAEWLWGWRRDGLPGHQVKKDVRKDKVMPGGVC